MFALFAIATTIVFIAFHTPTLGVIEEMTEEELEGTEIKSKQAVFFAIMASVFLLVLYLLLKYKIVVYVAEVAVTLAAAMTCSLIIQEFVTLALRGKWDPNDPEKLHVYQLPCCGGVTWYDALCTMIGLTLGFSWYFTRHWLLNNMLGLSMALTFLKTVRLNRLTPGLILLGLLFFYDIFWVFFSTRFTSGGQSVMVAVATGFDAPIKLLMPHITMDYPTTNCSLLGLGDIVIPGVFIGFLVRFGKVMTGPGANQEEGPDSPLVASKPTTAYRNAAFIAYFVALVTCGICLWLTHNA